MQASLANSQRLLERLIRLHPKYGSAEQFEAANLLAQFMRDAGFDTVDMTPYRSSQLRDLPGYTNVAALGDAFAQDGVAPKVNVIGTIAANTSGPTLLINGHYDVDVVTASNDWREADFWRSARVEGNRLYGRGATDMLGGLCAGLAAASTLAESRDTWCGRIVVMAVTDEEVGGNGTLHALQWLVDHALLPDDRTRVECIIPEPSEGRVCTRSLGLVQCRISVKAHPSHAGSSIPHSDAYSVGHESILGLSAAIESVIAYFGAERSRNGFLVNLGRIESGEDFTIRPAFFRADGIIFFPGEISRDDFMQALRRHFSAVAPAAAQLTFGDFYLDGSDFPGRRLRQIAGNSDGRYVNVSDELFRSPCDARHFKALDIETIICGPGRLEQAHAVDEYICLNELKSYFEDLVEVYRRFLAL